MVCCISISFNFALWLFFIPKSHLDKFYKVLSEKESTILVKINPKS